MEAVALAGVDNAAAMAHALVAPADLASAHRAEATDQALAHVAAMAVAQASMMSMAAPAMVAPREAMAAARVAMAALPAAAPAVTEDGEQTNKMKKPTDKIVNAINKMV